MRNPLLLVTCSSCGRLHESPAAMDAHPVCGNCLTHPPLVRPGGPPLPGRPPGR